MKWNKQYNYPTCSRDIYEGERLYDIGDSKLPSVTTILSATQSAEKQASLAAWRNRVGAKEAQLITTSAANRGSTMHHILECYLMEEPHLDLTTLGQQAHVMAENIINKGLKDRLTELWGLEVTLFYPELYAGATDVVGIYDGEQSIVDFKQSNKPKRREWLEDYKLQLAAYALAHNEIYGTHINKGVNLICTKDNLYQEFVFEGEEFRQAKFEWLSRVGTYYKQKEEVMNT